MKRIALIGDSIRLGYEPFLRELESAHRVVSSPENNGDSTNLLEHFDEWFRSCRADVLHANCGLHDLRLWANTGGHQISPAEYEANLGELAGRFRSLPGTTVIWALTTPVVEDRHNRPGREFARYNRDVERYNAIARSVMAASGVAVHDLHAVVLRAGPDRVISDDGVHFLEEGSRLLARSVAEALSPYLG